MTPVTQRQFGRTQLCAALLLSVLLLLPFTGTGLSSVVLRVTYVVALVLAVVALGLLLAPTAHRMQGRTATSPVAGRDDPRFRTGRAALLLATTSTTLLLLGHAFVTLTPGAGHLS